MSGQSRTKHVRGLPTGWRWVKLGDLCRFVNGDAYKESDWSAEGVQIIRIQNLNDTSKPFNYWPGSLHDRVQVKNGDLLLAWSGTPGTSFGAHIWTRGPGVLNQHIFLVHTDASLDKVWAKYAINHVLDDLIRAAHGAVGLAHVTKRQVEALTIPLPPLHEQKRLATILNEQMAAVERARKVSEERLAAVNNLPPTYLRTAFPTSDKELLPGWRWVICEDVCELLPSRSISSVGDTEVQAVTTACLTERGFDPCGVKTARMWAKDVSQCTLSVGEVLIARSNTPELVGRCSIYAGEPSGAVASDLTIRLRVHQSGDPDYFAAYLSALFMQGHWRMHAGGASGSMKKITRTQIAALRIPLPAMPEQRRVADLLKAQMAAVDRARNAAKAEVEIINSLPTATLRRALSGEL